ncbi:MAG TPA: TAXI family TRAP transporter solute-binding subunit [Hyphomicrobiaceae bacterium]|nr:TAXI family TRAP transporter solute-binding subunit [Hyphomicrobiaceae bacterium]
MQFEMIHVVFRNCCLIGETMSANFGVWWCGPAAPAILVLGLFWGFVGPSAQEAQFFRIGAAATSGTFFEVGGVIASAISKPAGSPACEHGGSCGVPGLVAVTQATRGSVDNLRMIAAGQIESGIAQSDIVSWGYAGTGIFAADGPMKQLRAIASLFPENVQLVVRGDSSIRTVADLKDKHISLGQMGSGTLADARVLLAAAGLTEKDIKVEYLRPGVAAANIKDGTLDGFFLIGGVPVPAIRELAATTPIRLIPIDVDILSKMRESSSSYRRSVIPPGAYQGVDTETPSIGLNALWIVSAEVSDDLIYAITKALWNEATERLLEAHNAIGKQVRLKNALDGLSVPLHPGARRFYREAGLPVDDDGAIGKRD